MYPPPSSDMIKSVYNELFTIMEIPVGRPDMAEIDRELTPLLAELLTLGPRQENHPSVRQLFHWLVHPTRTVDEFNYVVGPLSHHVYIVMCDHFYSYMHKRMFRYPIYCGQAAAEALSVKSPVLEGPWEHSAWLLVRLLRYYDQGGLPSDRLNDWIIQVIGDDNLCPNAYLRIELMFLFKMVPINKHNQTQAIEAMMSACSALSIDYLSGFWYSDFSILNFKPFYKIFSSVIKDGCLPQFGARLANNLKEVNTKRLCDVSYRYGIKHYTYSEPKELQSLNALIITSAEYMKKEMKFIEDTYDASSMTYFVYDVFETLICNFQPCYKMPQLIQPTATLVMNVLEFMLKAYELHGNWNHCLAMYVTCTDKLVQELLTEEGSITVTNSPITRELISRYSQRLRNIRERCSDLDAYPTICTILEAV